METRDWYKIGMANAYGRDKLTFKQRIGWFNETFQDGSYKIAEQPEDLPLALSMQGALEGRTDAPVRLDASASGFQVLACLANCEKTARVTNLIGEDFTDPYAYGISKMVGLDHIDRKLKKQAMMTAMYGSTAVPRNNLGEENLHAFYEMLGSHFTGPWNVFLYIQSLWRSDVTSHRWTMPDGFEVIQWNTIMEEQTCRLFGSEVTVRKKVKTTKERGLNLAANITHAQWA